jgi:hypothetical protein
LISRDSTLTDICFAVSDALDAQAMPAVLCGGSAAAVYAPQSYMSYDADFVLDNDDALNDVARVLATIGFQREGSSRIFIHPSTSFTVDFPKGPLAVGGEYVRETAVLYRGTRQLRIVSRTDCVRDRLSHFYFWDDKVALNAAVAVASNGAGDVNLKLIREWTGREDPALLGKFQEFMRRLDHRHGSAYES